MNKYICWYDTWNHLRPRSQGDVDKLSDGDTEEVEAYSASDAAERYADRRFADFEYPSELYIYVRPYDGQKWECYYVDVIPVPEFKATLAQ